MKKLLAVFTLLIVAVTFSLQAQTKMGLKGGINLSTYKFSVEGESFSPDRLMRPNFGIFFNNQISEEFAVGYEFLFYGTGFTGSDGFTNLDVKISYNYIGIPILLKYCPSSNINFHAAPQLSALVSGSEINGVKVTDGMKTFELAIGFGTEVFLSDNFGLSFRYIIGLSNVDDYYDGEIKMKSDVLQFSTLIGF